MITKKEFESFLITMDFEDRFEILESIVSFLVTCSNSCNGIDASDSVLFFEDSVYQAVDTFYGDGRYGGVFDNTKSSVTFGIINGIVGNKYKITTRLTTNLGNAYEEDIVLEITENVDSYFQKQPSEKFTILLDFKHRLNNADIRYDDTISSQAVTVVRESDGVDVTGSIVFASGVDGTEKIKIGVQAGSDNEAYRITSKIVSTHGYKYQVDLIMNVKEQ